MMKEKMVKVEGHTNLYRNSSGAIVNTDKDAYEAYKRKREASIRREESIDSLETQLKQAKDEIEELKSLIKEFLHK